MPSVDQPVFEQKAGLAFPKEPPRKRSKAHLAFVRGLPCLICKQVPADAHHLKFAQPRTLGRKVSDEFTVPLCRTHHQLLHRQGNEKAWWADMQLDPLPIARDLWASSPVHVAALTEPPPASVPTVIEAPYTCLPIAGIKAYDLSSADPRPIAPGGGTLADNDRFFVWNSRIKARHSSLDYYWQPNLDLFGTPEALVERWLDESVVLEGCLYIKTHSHSLESSYGLGAGEGLNPHSHPKVIGLFELLERVCDTAQVPLRFATVNEVMADLRLVDAASSAKAAAQPTGAAATIAALAV